MRTKNQATLDVFLAELEVEDSLKFYEKSFYRCIEAEERKVEACNELFAEKILYLCKTGECYGC